MLWLKAWLETRWRLVWMLLMSALLFAVPLEVVGDARAAHPQVVSMLLLRFTLLIAFLAPSMLAGSGVQTVSTRPNSSDKGIGESLLFTLSLPVTRSRLFMIRTLTGVLETVALLTLVGIVAWYLMPQHLVAGPEALGFFAAAVCCSLVVYAISACLSTFCDDGWRFRGTAMVIMALFIFATAHRLPLIPYRISWLAAAAAGVLTLLLLGAALAIIQKRDY
jgi:ABC-type transport system involved in multi-copper enzyme maturation permease subunit